MIIIGSQIIPYPATLIIYECCSRLSSVALCRHRHIPHLKIKKLRQLCFTSICCLWEWFKIIAFISVTVRGFSCLNDKTAKAYDDEGRIIQPKAGWKKGSNWESEARLVRSFSGDFFKDAGFCGNDSRHLAFCLMLACGVERNMD